MASTSWFDGEPGHAAATCAYDSLIAGDDKLRWWSRSLQHGAWSSVMTKRRPWGRRSPAGTGRHSPAELHPTERRGRVGSGRRKRLGLLGSGGKQGNAALQASCTWEGASGPLVGAAFLEREAQRCVRRLQDGRHRDELRVTLTELYYSRDNPLSF
jgi:hypothetical protein